jgi:pimeloyl-ACP methyl ester carboxylesterase
MADFNGRGFKIHYVQQGQGPAVVFAHGFVMDHTMFAPQFEDLPDTYRCVAWDMRGHGASDCPPGPWTMQDTVVDMIDFIEATGTAPCHLVGMSWGGMIAMRVAIQREDLVRSVVLIDTDAGAEGAEQTALYTGYADTVAEQGVTRELVEATLPLFYAEKYRTTQPDGIAVHIDRATDMPREAIVEGVRALVSRDSVLDRLGEIRVPALVIHGEEDAAQPIANGQRLADGIPGARLVRIPEAGHTSPLEAPDAVNLALAEFLASVVR